MADDMLNDDQMNRLIALRREITSIIGFYQLIDDNVAKTPLSAMLYEVHLKAAAVKTATELWTIITEVMDDIDDDDP